MRKLISAVFLIAIVAIAVLLFAPSLIPAATYKPQIESAVSSALGRDVKMAGDVRFSFFPRIEVLVQDVTVSNADWATAENFASIAELGLGLELMPLLSGKISLQRFSLTDPVINLESDSQGRTNWDFAGSSGQPAAGGSGAAVPATETAGAGAVQDVTLGDVQLINGRIVYKTPAGVETYDKINLSVGLVSLDAPMTLDGSLLYNNLPVSLGASVQNPRMFTEGGESVVDVKLKSDLANAAFDGDVLSNDAGMKLTGDLNLDVTSVAGLSRALTGTDEGVAHLSRLGIKGRIDANEAQASFNSASINIEDMTGSGDLLVKYGGARPHAGGALKFDKLDFNRLIGLTAASQTTQQDGAGNEGNGKAAGQSGKKDAGSEWSSEPIDFKALRDFDADLELTADKLFFQDLKFSKSDLVLKLRNGVMNADLRKIDLYGGTGKGALKVDASKAAAVIDSSFTLESLQTLPFLTDAVGLERLEGIGSFTYNVSTRGKSEQQLMRNLNGTSKLNVIDGAWKGVDLANMARTVQGFLKKNEDTESAGQDSVGADEKTDFAEMGGTFNIEKGVIKNNDFKLLNPFVRVTGNGDIDLFNQRVDFKLVPKFVKSATGQGGDLNLEGVSVPIIVEGPLSALKYRADVGSALQEAILPGSSGQSTEDVLKGVIGDLIGKDKKEETTQPATQETQPKKKNRKKKQQQQNSADQTDPAAQEDDNPDAEDLLKDLLGIE